MTRDEIMAMPAGPDIDRLVAEALGKDTSTLTEHQWGNEVELDNSRACTAVTCERCCEFRYTCKCGMRQEITAECTPLIARYSTDIAAAWKAWEAMPKERWGEGLANGFPGGLSLTFCGSDIHDSWHIGYDFGCEDYYWVSYADTVPMAICRALLVLELEEASQ